MKIPVFVSRPSTLNTEQFATQEALFSEFDSLGLEPRTLRQSDYPTEAPIGEVVALARHCAGAAILGFVQLTVQSGVLKPGTATETKVDALYLGTAWNQVEGGILYALKLPLLVFRERGVTEGIFEKGSSEFFIQDLPVPWASRRDPNRVHEVLLKWQGQVRMRYHGGSWLAELDGRRASEMAPLWHNPRASPSGR